MARNPRESADDDSLSISCGANRYVAYVFSQYKWSNSLVNPFRLTYA